MKCWYFVLSHIQAQRERKQMRSSKHTHAHTRINAVITRNTEIIEYPRHRCLTKIFFHCDSHIFTVFCKSPYNHVYLTCSYDLMIIINYPLLPKLLVIAIFNIAIQCFDWY